MNEVMREIISKSLLEEYGYDSEGITTERLEEIADQMMNYWGESGGFEEALRYAMEEE